MYKLSNWKHRTRATITAWTNCRRGIYVLIVLGLLAACQQKAETKTASVPIDTTIVDDDTLEVDDGQRQPPALAH